MKVLALASGSSGNAYLVSEGDTSLLVEAGLPPNRLEDLLASVSIDPLSLTAILLTHAHADHAQGARALSDSLELPIYASPGTLGHQSLRDGRQLRAIQPGASFRIGDVEIAVFRVPHDCAEPVGFRISGSDATMALLTDLGVVPNDILPWLHALDLLVIEANHDERMLWSGPYPATLKQRVGSLQGHLSNEAAAQCVLALGDGAPREIWLAHLSLVNNEMALALQTVRSRLLAVDRGRVPVKAAGRNSPSLRWDSSYRLEQQLDLFPAIR